MIIYLSGNTGLSADIETGLFRELGAKNRCISYWVMWDGSPNYAKESWKLLDTFLKDGAHIFLDSGAFTLQRAHGEMKGLKKKLEGTLEETVEGMFGAYCDFCQQYKDRLDCYVTFDYRSNAALAWKMTERMWKKGLEPVPVFHGDVDPVWLVKYVKHGCDWLGISGLTATQLGRASRTSKFNYLDTCFNVLKRNGNSARIHAFASTGLEIMTQYPWYSTDSSTWVRRVAYGTISYPDFERRRFITLHVSHRGVGDARTHMIYWTLAARQRKVLDEMFERRGTNVEKLAAEKESGRVARLRFNIQTFLEVEKYLDEHKVEYEPRHRPLFD